MIQFFINGEEIDVKLEGEKTIGDVLKSFELTCEENNAAVIGISIDDTIIIAENFDSYAEKELSKDNKFEFSIVTEDSIKESFTKLAELFNQLSIKMQEIPVDLQNGKNLEAIESIKKLADSIDQFCHIAALASLFPETFNKTLINGMDFKVFFDEFSPILLDFEEALKNNDTVLIGDLSEYEICPRLQEISTALKNI